jgi:pantoate--beta-alanine ligase
VVSIFVNPRQFNDPDDLKKYPRPLEQDLKMLEEAGVDVVFIPDVNDIYPEGDEMMIDFDPGAAAETMEGKFRPGHFKGMAEVVYRLLKIVDPDQLYMGQKDFQQFAIIRKLIHDFEMHVKLIMCPTIRESHGLAMSSRNIRLSAEARIRAGSIFQNLLNGKNAFSQGESLLAIQQTVLASLQHDGLEPEYFEIVDGFTLEDSSDPDQSKQIIACCAVKVEGIRLIDNMIWKEI